MVIRIEPQGGLGNQLFIYAAGKALALQLGVSLVADCRAYRNRVWPAYELDSFASELVVEEPDLARERKALAIFRARRKLGLSNSRFARDWGINYQERSFRYDSQVFGLGDNSRLRGYFQSWKYSEGIRDILIDELASVREPTPWFEAEAKKLSDAEPWIGLQVRRGDYVGNKFMGIAGVDYFNRGLELLRSLTGVRKVVVFSDEPFAVQDELNNGFDFSYELITPPPSSRPIESLNLLSRASHLCISNSTFGWWAAWLGSKQNRKVVVPRPWVDMVGFDDFSLHPPEWISVGR